MTNPMLKVTVGDKEVEVSAKDVLRSEAARRRATSTVEPGTLAVLAVLIEAVVAVAVDVETDINNPLTLLLKGKQQASDVLVLISEVQQFLTTLGVKA